MAEVGEVPIIDTGGDRPGQIQTILNVPEVEDRSKRITLNSGMTYVFGREPQTVNLNSLGAKGIAFPAQFGALSRAQARMRIVEVPSGPGRGVVGLEVTNLGGNRMVVSEGDEESRRSVVLERGEHFVMREISNAAVLMPGNMEAQRAIRLKVGGIGTGSIPAKEGFLGMGKRPAVESRRVELDYRASRKDYDEYQKALTRSRR